MRRRRGRGEQRGGCSREIRFSDQGQRIGRQLKAEEVFVKLLRRTNEQGRRVSPSRSPSYAPTQFSKHPDREGCSKADFEHAMENLLFAYVQDRGLQIFDAHGKLPPLMDRV